jgi:hypothetical protein
MAVFLKILGFDDSRRHREITDLRAMWKSRPWNHGPEDFYARWIYLSISMMDFNAIHRKDCSAVRIVPWTSCG